MLQRERESVFILYSLRLCVCVVAAVVAAATVVVAAATIVAAAAVAGAAAAGRSALIRSPTGTGKTLAYVLPLLQLLQQQQWPREEPIIILTPTRELAEQVAAQFYR